MLFKEQLEVWKDLTDLIYMRRRCTRYQKRAVEILKDMKCSRQVPSCSYSDA